MDKRMAELVKFSQEFKVRCHNIFPRHEFSFAYHPFNHLQLKKPIPEDLVPILAKDEDKQKAIKEKAERDAQSAKARVIGQATPARGVPVKAEGGRKPGISQASSSKNVTGQPSAPAVPKAPSGSTTPAKLDGPTKKPHMIIQAIPPFKGNKKPPAPTSSNGSASLASGPPGTNGTSAAANNNHNAPPISPISANRLNVNASSFRPNPKANAFSPVRVSPFAMCDFLKYFPNRSHPPRTRRVLSTLRQQPFHPSSSKKL